MITKCTTKSCGKNCSAYRIRDFFARLSVVHGDASNNFALSDDAEDRRTQRRQHLRAIWNTFTLKYRFTFVGNTISNSPKVPNYFAQKKIRQNYYSTSNSPKLQQWNRYLHKHNHNFTTASPPLLLASSGVAGVIFDI